MAKNIKTTKLSKAKVTIIIALVIIGLGLLTNLITKNNMTNNHANYAETLKSDSLIVSYEHQDCQRQAVLVLTTCQRETILIFTVQGLESAQEDWTNRLKQDNWPYSLPDSERYFYASTYGTSALAMHADVTRRSDMIDEFLTIYLSNNGSRPNTNDLARVGIDLPAEISYNESLSRDDSIVIVRYSSQYTSIF